MRRFLIDALCLLMGLFIGLVAYVVIVIFSPR